MCWYRRLDEEHRLLADVVIADWLLSDSEAKRFDAVGMVREFRIKQAVTALSDLARRLACESYPAARFEREGWLAARVAVARSKPEQHGRVDPSEYWRCGGCGSRRFEPTCPAATRTFS